MRGTITLNGNATTHWGSEHGAICSAGGAWGPKKKVAAADDITPSCKRCAKMIAKLVEEAHAEQAELATLWAEALRENEQHEQAEEQAEEVELVSDANGTRLANPARYALDYPAVKGETVTEGHARYCAEFGHGRRTVNGELHPLCPRCGESVLTDRQLHVQGPNGGTYIFQGLGYSGGLPVVWVSRNAGSPLVMIDRAHFEKRWCAVDASGYPQPRTTRPTAVATFNYLASTWERDKGVRYLFLGTELDNGETFAWVGNPAGGHMRVTLAELVQRFVAVPSGEETEDEVRWDQVWQSRYVSGVSQWHKVRVVEVPSAERVTVRSMANGKRSTLSKAMFVELFRWTPEPGADNYGRAL